MACGPRTYVSERAYGAARDRCIRVLFEQIAREHGVSPSRVSESLGRNRAHIDAAVILPFALLCCFIAVAVARMMWRRYPSFEGWIPGAIVALFLSLVYAVGSTMLGEQWSWLTESCRIGNDHMSYRVQRLFWVRHRTELFVGAVIVFWLAAATEGARQMRSKHSLPPRDD